MNPALYRLMPGLEELAKYPRQHLRADLSAGLSVAAVSLPVSVAYAQLAGLSPAAGLYSSVLPMVAYALFGSSRQLIVGPDAATSAMIAATLMPLAVAGSEDYQALAVSLTLLTGIFCMVASRFRFGFLADFLSVPILTGLLNGVAVSIVISQFGKVTGLALAGRDAISQILSLAAQAGQVHLPTFFVAVGTAALYLTVKAFWPRGPAALSALVAAVAGSLMFRAKALGVAMVGALPSGLPGWVAPSLPHEMLGTLVPAAAGLALISFSSGMLTSRSFAVRNGYRVDANREFLAIGVADVVSALSQGFAISGSSSRTVVNEGAGGRTRLVSVVAAAAMLLVLLVLGDVLALVPVAALGAILVASALGLIDLGGLMALRRFSRAEHAIALVTLAGVVLFGVMSGILVAVTLALLRFLVQMARPSDQLFGIIPGHEGLYELAHYPEAQAVPGLLIYRFESPLTFFNADYFSVRVAALVEAQAPRWVVIDAVSIASLDLTGALAIRDLQEALAKRGIQLVIAGRTAQLLAWLDRRGIAPESTGILYYPNRLAALAAFEASAAAAQAAAGDGGGPSAVVAAPGDGVDDAHGAAPARDREGPTPGTAA
ncbi:SulP family inorganic anion transporter [Cupriavidus malaysiensis]|uniref:STAS domain-containing protein n=1 Tax=Cupriavidus malaysiensis TaxID=367825 RepID=A0ABN4TNV2_9BURK|nr:SulP family inorganic anion transporter [Cupriavidus malaysiensis]AOZ08998.1 hypothetical protein BKK80_24365 [Cupriavidus malaysiensis]